MKIVTDTASDITKQQAKKMGIDLVPLGIVFEDEPFYQNDEKDFEIFYEKLKTSKQLPKTSSPSPEQYLHIFKEAQKCNDEVLVLTLSSGLSGTAASAFAAKKMIDYEKIYVVDTHQAIIGQRMIVEYAVHLRNLQVKVDEIVKKIEEIRDRIVICGVVDTLIYLKKGGRIPASLATIGELFHIKPVIVLEDTILKVLAKVRGTKAGISRLYDRLDKDRIDREYPVYFGYTTDRTMGENFMQDTCKKYSLKSSKIYPVGGIIGTHCGTRCIAVAYVKMQEPAVNCV